MMEIKNKTVCADVQVLLISSAGGSSLFCFTTKSHFVPHFMCQCLVLQDQEGKEKA